MTITLIVAFLAGHYFETACVQTQDNGKSGYAIDSAHFTRADGAAEGELSVQFTRTLYMDANCKSDGAVIRDESGKVTVGKSVADGFFSTNSGEERFEADWNFSGDAAKIEKGSIGIDARKESLRIARNAPGFNRNTMLQVIVYQGTTR